MIGDICPDCGSYDLKTHCEHPECPHRACGRTACRWSNGVYCDPEKLPEIPVHAWELEKIVPWGENPRTQLLYQKRQYAGFVCTSYTMVDDDEEVHYPLIADPSLWATKYNDVPVMPEYQKIDMYRTLGDIRVLPEWKAK